MTIRSGGRARDSQAHPAERGTYDETWQPHYEPELHGSGPGGGNDNGGSNDWNNAKRNRRGIPGFLKFLVFAVVLGAIVLGTLITVMRPLVRSAIVGWADDNPAALGMPFVADLVREDLGTKLTDPASADTSQIVFTVTDGENATEIAGRLQDEGFLADRRSFIFLASERGLEDRLQAGDFILRK